MLTESCHSQDKCDHNGDPGDPQSFLPVVLCLMGLQAHAALKKTCTETTYTNNVTLSFFLAMFLRIIMVLHHCVIISCTFKKLLNLFITFLQELTFVCLRFIGFILANVHLIDSQFDRCVTIGQKIRRTVKKLCLKKSMNRCYKFDHLLTPSAFHLIFPSNKLQTAS